MQHSHFKREKKDTMPRKKESVPKNKNSISLPKISSLPGAVCAQKVRCGKPNCRCAKGELHEGYYYYFFYVGGTLHKRYIKKADDEAVKQACLKYRQDQQAIRLFNQQAAQEWRVLRRLIREILG
jgi:hypothetical protein